MALHVALCHLSFILFLLVCVWLQIDENVAREIINHRSLRHPNIIRFKEASILVPSWISDNLHHMSVQDRIIHLFCYLGLCTQLVLTPTHLAIVMEYAAGGELFERICSAGRFSEDEVF